MHILKKAAGEPETEWENGQLEPCPICGKKAYVAHMVVDGFEFGWDAGCPTAKRDDGVHGVGWDDEITADNFPRVSYRVTKDGAITAWNEWVRKWKERHGANG